MSRATVINNLLKTHNYSDTQREEVGTFAVVLAFFAITVLLHQLNCLNLLLFLYGHPDYRLVVTTSVLYSIQNCYWCVIFIPAFDKQAARPSHLPELTCAVKTHTIGQPDMLLLELQELTHA